MNQGQMFMISQPWPKVIVESVSQQEEIFPQPLEVEELLVETLVDIPAELTLKLVPLWQLLGYHFS